MTASPFTDSYRPTFTRTYQVVGDLRSLVTGEACDLWRANRLVEELDPVLAARWVSLRIEYLLDEGSPTLCFDWELRLEDIVGRQLARVEAEEEIVSRADDTGAAYDIGGPTARGTVNGRVQGVAALRDGLRRFLPASIVRKLAGINVLGPWVAESLARTWAWFFGHGAFDAPAEELTPAWEQAVAEAQPPVEVQPSVEDSYGWITQSQQCWDDFLHDRITAAGLEDGDVPLDHARQVLLRLLAPLAEPYGVTLGQDGELLIHDDADENAAREVCRRALTEEVVTEAIHNARYQTEEPLCCILHAWVPGACSRHAALAGASATHSAGLPPVAVPEHHPETRDVLAGLELLPGENRRVAAAWRSFTARHGAHVRCRGVARDEDGCWRLWWASDGGYSSDRQWVVEYLLAPRLDGELEAAAMLIRTSSRDGSGRYLLPALRAEDTLLVGEALRRRLIADGQYQLALDALAEGRIADVCYGDAGEPYIVNGVSYEEALTRGLEYLNTLPPTRSRPAEG